ncbi:NAD-dependent epimerase/dehydratase family protein [Brevundimonas sp.]|uniref:NAD-dependent epimerase/dehydratase family protein n=1 Tax=Brevundimonas sp. TaxID=1871086 RepID=UPI003D136244
MTEKIVVFGGSGFIGTHLLRRLAADHSGRLVSVDLREPKSVIAGVDYVVADVRDLSRLEIEGTISTIYNLAAVHTTPGHPDHEYYDTNIGGATAITAFARERGVRDIVFTSSISVYGPGEDPKLEGTPPAPESSYGWSKWLSEAIFRAWLDEQDDRRLVVCRPAVIFGAGEGGNFTRLAKLMRAGLFVYPGRRDTVKACFYVEDLVDALLYAHGLNERYVLFNGCYPDRYTLEQIVEAFTLHFPRVRTVTVPRAIVNAAAAALKPISALNLGIHPDRVTKLVRSTDIRPGWLAERNRAREGQLAPALCKWAEQSGGLWV